MSNITTQSKDIAIGNDLGRKKITIMVGMGSEDFITLPTAVWNYEAIVSALVRHKYSESDVEAIVSNSLLLMQSPSSISEDEVSEKQTEFTEFQEYREKCKARAKELLEIGKKMGLTEMYG